MLTVYRKYRAKNFSEIIGQDNIVSVLKQAVKDGRIAHAYLFSGPRGTGKTSMARIIAKAVNCLNLIDGEPCNECSNCKAINKARFLDLIEIDAASNRGIEEIRELKGNVGFLPVEGRFKVYIIDEVHMLTDPAFNALLKTLEEPPQSVLFILATTEPQKLPLTIISRTQRFDFKIADNDSLLKKLKYILEKEKLNFTTEALELIIKAGQGSFRDAETVLEKVISARSQDNLKVIEKSVVENILGYVDSDTIKDIVDCLIANKGKEALNLLDQVHNKGLNLNHFIKELLEECRDRMNTMINRGSSNEEIKKCLFIINSFNEANNEIRFSPLPILNLEVAVIKITQDSFKQETKRIEEPKIKEVEKVEETKIENMLSSEEIVESLKNNWNSILTSAKKYNHYLTAILAKVFIEKDEDAGSVTFKVGSLFHKQRLENKQTRKILNGLFNEICGIDTQYKCIIDKTVSTNLKEESNSKLVEEFLN